MGMQLLLLPASVLCAYYHVISFYGLAPLLPQEILLKAKCSQPLKLSSADRELLVCKLSSGCTQHNQALLSQKADAFCIYSTGIFQHIVNSQELVSF